MIKNELHRLELRLLEPAVRKSPKALGELLDKGFWEIGANGESYDRKGIIRVLGTGGGSPVVSIREFEAVLLAPGTALATFKYFRAATKEKAAGASWRSSIWKRAHGRWRLVFHQGTRCA